MEPEPVRKGTIVQVELGYIVEKAFGSITRCFNSIKGCLGGVDSCGALRRLLREAKFRLGATTSHSRPSTPEPPEPPACPASLPSS